MSSSENSDLTMQDVEPDAVESKTPGAGLGPEHQRLQEQQNVGAASEAAPQATQAGVGLEARSLQDEANESALEATPVGMELESRGLHDAETRVNCGVEVQQMEDRLDSFLVGLDNTFWDLIIAGLHGSSDGGDADIESVGSVEANNNVQAQTSSQRTESHEEDEGIQARTDSRETESHEQTDSLHNEYHEDFGPFPPNLVEDGWIELADLDSPFPLDIFAGDDVWAQLDSQQTESHEEDNGVQAQTDGRHTESLEARSHGIQAQTDSQQVQSHQGDVQAQADSQLRIESNEEGSGIEARSGSQQAENGSSQQGTAGRRIRLQVSSLCSASDCKEKNLGLQQCDVGSRCIRMSATCDTKSLGDAEGLSDSMWAAVASDERTSFFGGNFPGGLVSHVVKSDMAQQTPKGGSGFALPKPRLQLLASVVNLCVATFRSFCKLTRMAFKSAY